MTPHPPLGDPAVTWGEDGTPQSGAFGDVYFSRGQGVAESRHVFLRGCGLPQAWQGRDHFTIGETGFGTGLNLLLAWQAWREDEQRPARLDLVSVEGFPLTAEDAARALASATESCPALAPLVAALAAEWPPRQPGFHRVAFEGGRVRFLILQGPVEAMLERLDARVDAWFLDGFAPARNGAMWTPEVLARLAALSAPGARLATFTAAGAVRRGLQAAGFAVSKVAGYGHKRESLTAVLETPPPLSDHPAPWFARPSQPAPRRVVVIGAGVGGCAAARALGRAGCAVVVVDRTGDAGAGASGNPLGMLKPRLTADGGLHGRFHALAYLHARRLLDRLPQEAGVWAGARGILSVARDAAERRAMERLAGTLVATDCQGVEAEEAGQLGGGITAPWGGLWFPRAGTIRPAAVCRALLGETPLLTGEVAGLHRTPEGVWQVHDPCGTLLAEADAVVLAAGPWVPALWPAAGLPIRCNRGEITLLPEGAAAPPLTLSFGGYLTPALPQAVLGATYDRLPKGPETPGWDQPRPESAAHNRAVLAAALPAVAESLGEAAGARVGLRATIDDHMPMVGPLFREETFRQQFEDLRHGRRRGAAAAPPPWEPGLWVLGALGSRGFQTAPLLAETLAALMTGGPLPLERDLLHAVHPARFLVRALKRGQ